MNQKKSLSNIRVRNCHTERINKNKIIHFHPNTLESLKKQHNQNIIPSFTALPSLTTDPLLSHRKIKNPLVIVDSIKKNMRKDCNPQQSINETENNTETDKNYNCHQLNTQKTHFRTKKILTDHKPLKNNNSFALNYKSQPHDDFIYSTRYRVTSQLNGFCDTSICKKMQIRKNKERKCLIVNTRKLPFSLQRQSKKRKQTQATRISNSHQELFDLDISIIQDEHEGPGTPFIRRGSDIEEVFNFA